VRTSNKKPKQRIERRTLSDGSIKTYIYDSAPKKVANSQTVSHFLDEWQRSLEWKELKPSSKRLYETYIKHLYDAFKHEDIKTIERGHLLTVRDVIANVSGHGAAATFCRASSVFFKWCVEYNKIKISPATNMLKPLKSGHWSTWTLDQALKAEAELPAPYNKVVYLARHTAQRRGDLCNMCWADYDGSYIKVIQQKTGTALNIPVSGDFKTVLDQWKAETKGLTILQNKDGTRIDPATLTSYFARVLKRHGFPEGLNVHGLRKLAAVTAAEAGCTVHEIAALTGHKSLKMVQLYTENVNQQKVADAAVVRIADYVRTRSTLVDAV
jgi:integrase